MLTMMVVMALVAAPAEDAQAAIKAALDASAAGWSSGDMTRFMAVYADDAVFVARDGLVRGKPAIAARYAQHYGAETSGRGALSFRVLGYRQISNVHQMLWARWTLTYSDGKSDSGVTSLLFERRPAGWKIISDHSS